ncbi:MAG: fumarylacetoacetate hydrolase family protein [Burkholderiaceae bacterium]
MSNEPIDAVSSDAATPVSPEPPAPAWSVDELTEQLVAARRGRARVTAERVQATVKSSDIAYRIQASVDAALWPDDRATVWKAGADSRDSLPTAAPIAPPLVHASGVVLPASAFPVCIVEAEIAYRFGTDLPPRTIPYTGDEVAGAIAAMHVAIEIVTPRIVDFATASALAKLADHGLNGAFVLGGGIDDWRRVDLRRQKVTLAIDGKVHETAVGSHALGNPAVLLPWFVAHLGRLPTLDPDGRPGAPRGVKAGDIVTTGSWTKVVEARARQRVDVRFVDIGEVSVAFTAS